VPSCSIPSADRGGAHYGKGKVKLGGVRESNGYGVIEKRLWRH
jgi:hypothetical protein